MVALGPLLFRYSAQDDQPTFVPGVVTGAELVDPFRADGEYVGAPIREVPPGFTALFL
jgi:hypothetical protein